MSASLSRRALLRASPAALALPAALVATAARPSGTDPHPALLAEFRQVREEWTTEINLVEDDTPHTEALWAERNRLADAIRTTVATTAAGLLAQVEFMAEDYDGGHLAAVGATINDVPASFLETIASGLRRLA